METSQAKADKQNAELLNFFTRMGEASSAAPILKAMNENMADLEKEGATEAPVDTGFLRASIRRVPAEISADAGYTKVKGQVAAPTKYAYTQHENTEFKHPRGGRDHYLSEPLDAKFSLYIQNLAKSVMTMLKGARHG